MTRLTIIVLLQLFSCSNIATERTLIAGKTSPTKNYTAQHTQALAFCKQQNFSQDYYFLVDLNVHSGRNRFYVYDFKSGKITNQNLVTHGSCDTFDDNTTKWEKAKCSNTLDSHCSSAGKYKVGKRDYSSWGIKVKYWLEGLEESNSNARDRVVVLHSWESVHDTEVYPQYSPLSWGCPAVSDNFMRTLDAKLQATPKPVLLWIID